MSRLPRFAWPMILAFSAAPYATPRPMDQITATRVVRFSPPSTLPERTKSGECSSGSQAADFRNDAVRCTAGGTVYDPCFQTSHADRVLCDVDPRNPASGTIVVGPTAAWPMHAVSAGGRGWFIELADGSTCQPLPGTRREVGGLVEMYTCKFGSTGDADAVLGDLDTSASVWTIQKVLINKKIDPPTIKSATAAPVRTVWQ